MSINVYSPLLIGSIVYSLVFLLFIIIFMSVRNETYFDNKVNNMKDTS